MNLESQLEPGPGADGVLAKATLDDLFSELKQRCTAIMVVMVVDDDDGDESIVTCKMGSRLTLLGACREFEHRCMAAHNEKVD